MLINKSPSWEEWKRRKALSPIIYTTDVPACQHLFIISGMSSLYPLKPDMEFYFIIFICSISRFLLVDNKNFFRLMKKFWMWVLSFSNSSNPKNHLKNSTIKNFKSILYHEFWINNKFHKSSVININNSYYHFHQFSVST